MTLLVALSYLALVATLDGGRRSWLLTYLGATTLALYTDQSALFALAPQALLLLALARHVCPRVAALLGAGLGAILVYLPWLPQVLAAAPATSAQGQFQLTPASGEGAVRSVLGLDATQAVFAGGLAVPWAWGDLPALHLALLVMCLSAAGVGIVALGRRGRLVLGVALALGPAVILVAIVVSLWVPSFAPRTVLPATLGWALLVGAAANGAHRRMRGLGAATVVVLALLVSVLTDAALWSGAYTQDWRGLAQDTAAAARLGWPVVTYPTVAGTLLGLYQPGLPAAGLDAVADGGSLPAAAEQRGAVWLAYPAGTGESRLVRALQAHGYRRVLHDYYPYPLYLDLYARSAAPLGTVLPAAPWRQVRAGVLRPGARAETDPPVLGQPQAGEEIAYADRAAAPDHLYTVQTTARATRGGGAGRVFLECLDARQAFTRVAPDPGGAVVPADGQAHVVRLAVLCPQGTTIVRVDLRAEGRGPVRFQGTRLAEAAPDRTAAHRSATAGPAAPRPVGRSAPT